MAWIEFHQELPRHPKIDIVMDVLDVGRAAAVGHVSMSWLWALEFASSGLIPFNRLGAAARASDWNGDKETFAQAMLEAGFWDHAEDGYRIHDWQKYIGRLLDKRQSDAERKARSRSASAGIPQDTQKPVRVTSAGHPRDGAGKPTVTNHNQPNTPPTPSQGNGADAPEGVPFEDGSFGAEEPAGDDYPLEDKTPAWKKDAAFVAFWESYPAKRRQGAAGCFAAWKREGLSRRAADVMARLSEDLASPDWEKEGGRFVPLSQTWLNRKRWLDDPAPSKVVQMRQPEQPQEPDTRETWERFVDFHAKHADPEDLKTPAKTIGAAARRSHALDFKLPTAERVKFELTWRKRVEAEGYEAAGRALYAWYLEERAKRRGEVVNG